MPIGDAVQLTDENKWMVHAVHEAEANIAMTIATTDPGDGDEVAQDLVDYLAAWPKLKTGSQITASRLRTYIYPVTPTSED